MPSSDLRFAPFANLARLLLSGQPEGRDGSHDVSHLHRVWRNAQVIQAAEGEGELELLAAAVLLHDAVAVEKSSPLRARASRLSAEHARVALHALGWDPARINIVADAIESHSYSADLTPNSVEGRILQDADRLDAIGAVGLARCFYTAGRMGSRLYHPDDPRGESRPLDDRHFALDHFPNKLLRLASGFQTAAGARLARKRHQWLQDYYDRLLDEIGP